MKKNIISFIKKQWLIIWIVLSSIVLFAIIASAESLFTLSPMKRVLVTKGGKGVLFSSNLLTNLIEETVEGVPTEKATYQPIYKTNSYDVDLYLWNYDILDETTRYPENINYRLEARLTDSEGNALTDIGSRTITITPTSPSGSSLVLSTSNPSGTFNSQTLVHSDSVSAQNYYVVEFSSNWNLDEDANICVEIKAIPTTNDAGVAYSDIPKLGRIIGLRKTRSTSTNGWKATISEKTDINSPTDFDAYNLVLSGSGSATITVSWDPTKIGLNEYFYKESKCVYGFDFPDDDEDTDYEIKDNGVSETDGWHTITIKADTSIDSRNNRNRYSIQLYKLGNQDDTINPTSWDFCALNQTAANSPNAWIRVNII